MSAAGGRLTEREERAGVRLYQVCDRLDRLELDIARPTAYERLEDEVGAELASFMVRALRKQPVGRRIGLATAD
jgi:hypothetical protein